MLTNSEFQNQNAVQALFTPFTQYTSADLHLHFMHMGLALLRDLASAGESVRIASAGKPFVASVSSAIGFGAKLLSTSKRSLCPIKNSSDCGAPRPRCDFL